MHVVRVTSDRPAGMSPPIPLLDRPAKTAVPVAHHVVDRPRLRALLDDGLQAPATVIAATAGWGKTLLAASWFASGSGGRARAWVTLDEGDDEPAVFWRTLAAALLPVAGDDATAALRRVAADPVDADTLPGALAAAMRLADKPVVLVLDNLHEVRSAAVHEGLLRFVERPLRTLSLLVLSRRDPPWPLTRLRLAGLLTEVRAEDLAFRADEAAALFAQLHVDVSPAHLELLVERTEGWAAGLRLVALHLQGRTDVDAAVAAFSGDDHSVAGYLVSEVLDHQPAELVEFLQTISTVDLVNADLADTLTGRDDSAQVLAELAASHLFVQTMDRPGRWYRLHRLIADVLRARPSPASARRDLHRRAAMWFNRHGLPLDAIASAVAGRLWRPAAELVSTHAVALIAMGRGRDLERVLARLPRAVLLGHPEFVAALAGARVVRGDATEVGVLLDAARATIGELSGRQAARASLLLDLITGAWARMNGDWDTAATVYRTVPVDTATLIRLRVDSAEVVPVIVNSVLGQAAFLAGDPETAEQRLHVAATAELATSTVSQLNASGYLALLWAELGELESAERAALEVVTAAGAMGLANGLQLAGAYLAMARVALDRGATGEVDEWLGRVAEVQAVAAEPAVRLAAAVLLAARRETIGDNERALVSLWTTTAQLGSWRPPLALREQALAVEARLRARAGDGTGAGALLEDLGEATTAAGALAAVRVRLLLGDVPAAVAARARVQPGRHPRARVETALLDALLADAAGDRDRALALLEEALVAAAPWGLRWTFLVESADLRTLLERRVDLGTVVPGFAIDLMEGMSGALAADVDARRALVDPLTDREWTILRYLASTLSNAEIAAELYVSVNTVKTHQRAVYRKLGAANRRDAVLRARAMNLL